MASRAEQKAAARAQREAVQAQHASSQARRMRLLWLGGVLGLVVLALVIVIAASSSGGKSGTPKSSKAAVASVTALLKGIPQSGNTLGNPNAKVTITEFGDLVCPICKAFAESSERQLIANEVRAGEVKLVYRGLETASATANASAYPTSQIAARAAGLQRRAWQYILLFYADQQSEDTAYVSESFLQGIARQVPGLSLAKWESDRDSSALSADLAADTAAASAAGWTSTPTVVASGPRGTVPLVTSSKLGFEPTYAQLQLAIKDVN